MHLDRHSDLPGTPTQVYATITSLFCSIMQNFQLAWSQIWWHFDQIAASTEARSCWRVPIIESQKAQFMGPQITCSHSDKTCTCKGGQAISATQSPQSSLTCQRSYICCQKPQDWVCRGSLGTESPQSMLMTSSSWSCTLFGKGQVWFDLCAVLYSLYTLFIGVASWQSRYPSMQTR